MAIIEILINKSKYKIECPESQQEKLLYLTKKLDDRIKKLAQNFKNSDEKTLLAIAALTLEDEIDLASSGHEEKIGENDMYDMLGENIDNIAEYIENLAKKIESY